MVTTVCDCDLPVDISDVDGLVAWWPGGSSEDCCGEQGVIMRLKTNTATPGNIHHPHTD